MSESTATTAVKRIETHEQLNLFRDSYKANLEKPKRFRVTVGMATCGISAGANVVLDAFNDALKARGIDDILVEPAGCIGLCVYEPIVEVFEPGKEKVSYVHITPDKVEEIVEKHLIGGSPVADYGLEGLKIYDDSGELCRHFDDLPFYKKQVRLVLKNCGYINPENIEEYIAVDGYQALAKVLTTMTPDDVINVISASNLRGRGGAGFPTGRKWKFAAVNESDQKYIICNADEGDPGAFMDRSVLEGDPHAVLEAMAIAGYAIGADQGWIYVRAEYPTAVDRLQLAIDEATARGLLGDNIFGSGFNFNIRLRLGAGAFVCGEETALIASIEGKRGMPRNKPPFPANRGLWGKPTIINNVETLANIAPIIRNGADWFRSIGTEKSPGTKVFALGGKIANTGLVEVPMGITLREVIYDIGGGCPGGKMFKAVQTGGPSGGCLTAEALDEIIDFDHLTALGSMMGSGGMIVMDEDNCMVDIARFFLDFTVDESCGQCVPCREGTKRMLEILDKIVSGKAKESDLIALEELAENIQLTSLCALGQTAPNPVLSTMHHFMDEYRAHVIDKKCPTHVCKDLLGYYITEDCRGCTLCKKVCPVDAISGEVKEQHYIDPDKCIRCGACFDACRFNAIEKR
ncbi:MAG: NADH-quinone oxidoreductase subunit NuoF [Clostridiaceae bacterium]|jgi:NADH:ubiquinone oxidoreductase subunit F (NADH-binding)/(2Fe-2S) ferredoxin/Pyruvate/2-oxoacid:ferredoxin oxidoreductase delta subunit|nr:NADH-quinone oxidoreductase subunit NuoF [Clostridiaceae bacterium]